MGDPLVNSRNTLDSVVRIGEKFPDALISVSTSGPKVPEFSNPDKFFTELKQIRNSGIPIRLQFSCQSTSNEDRARLHSHIPMMTLEEISNYVDSWYNGSKATLTFVPFEQHELDAEKLARIFYKEKVFVKISRVAEHEITIRNNLKNADESKIDEFISGLEKNGFEYSIKPKRDYYK
jgi:adenine C2-methylase RlmN of 23S rRNA A2503 and tRNA A37